MNYHRKPSKKDLAKKFGRAITVDEPDQLVWEVLGAMVDGLSSNETKLPMECLNRVIQTRDIHGLIMLSKELPLQMYGNPAVLLQDRSVVELFKKYPFKSSPFNTREKALIRFWEAEEACQRTNERLKSSAPIPNNVAWIIHRASREVHTLLGRFNLSEMLQGSRFGPGSTLCVTGAFTTQYFKLCEKSPTVSSTAFAYAEALLNYDKKWLAHLCGIHPLDVAGRFNLISDEIAPELRVTDYNKVTFVPKDATTERSIAIEPYFNLYFQLGAGRILRNKLRKWRINLDSQLRNQEFARLGSKGSGMATVDFSMASDTLALETVRFMLPPEWFDHLDRLRSKSFKLKGNIHLAHKFSTMGNGFTFELESLIFASLARAAHKLHGLTEDSVAVFGDDVIVHQDAYQDFMEASQHMGFTVNDSKSFTTGSFRESCGKDYLEGELVRPVFCKELTTVRDAISLANRLQSLKREMQRKQADSGYLDRAIDVCLRKVPRDVRRELVGPPTESMDTHIHTDDWKLLSQSSLVRYDVAIQSWRYPVIAFRAKRFRRKDASLALLIHQATNGGEKRLHNAQFFTPFASKRRSEPNDGISRARVYEVTGSAPMEVTGREVGELVLGTALRDGLLGVPNLSV